MIWKRKVGSTSLAIEVVLLLWLAAAASGQPVISGSLPNTTEIGATYLSAPVQLVTGGTPPYTWTLSTTLIWLSFNTDGSVTSVGSPSPVGMFSIKAYVTDRSSPTPLVSNVVTFNITINPAVQITAAALPAGQQGVAYPSTTLVATGGTGSYTWSLASGSLPLPPGLMLAANGSISAGPPTALGTFPFTAQATDGLTTATRGFSITIAAPPLAVLTTVLPSGEAGTPYAPPSGAALSATGGVPPYTWSATGLPAGLAVNPSTGIITGSLSASATTSTSVVITVTDSSSKTASSAALTLTVTSGPTITTGTTLPNGGATAPYSVTISATGGTPPYTKWDVSAGSLPAGLTLNSSTGTISGTPASSGIYLFTIQVTDSASVTATKPFTLTVASALVITTAPTLPSGTIGTPYSAALGASGGTPPYAWAVTSVGLPGGLSLNTAGLLSGIPSSSGTFTFTVQVRDSNSAAASQLFSLTVVSSLTITTAPQLPQGAVNTSYSQALAATGGTGPYTWTVVQGALPAGLQLSGGIIGGIPTANGAFTFSIQVTDNAGGAATRQFTLTIVAGLAITSGAALPQGTLGQAYGPFTLAVVGGNQPYTWSVSVGSMAPGLSLSSNGIITGTPSAAGAFNFTVQVKDNSGVTATVVFAISIVPPTLPQVTIGVPPTSPAGQQLPVGLSLASPYPLDIAGQITLSFQPDSIAPAVDPAMQFSTGGLTVTFTIPANTTNAVFPSSSQIALQTGTVSGTITLTFTLTAGGTQLLSLHNTVTIPRSAPVIHSVKLVRTSSGLEIHVVAFSPSRELTEADVTFTAAPGATLQTTTLTESLASVATAWYQSTGSAQYGSQLMLVLPITASQGSVNAVGSVSVVLKNAQGSSQANSGT